MFWFLVVAVVAVVIAVLDVLPQSGFVLAEFWTKDSVFYVMSMLLLGCAFLYQKFCSVAQSLRWLGRSLSLIFALLMGALLLGLFVLRAITTYTQFENNVPQTSHTIQATVSVDEISDSVYDKILNTDHRQKAVISDIKLVENSHKYADNAKTIANPFGIAASDVPNVQLPPTMTVLLTASAKSKQDLSILQKLTPNTRVTMTLVISAIKKDQAAGGFDGYRWLRTRHIHANAKIISVDGPISAEHNAGILVGLQTLRQRVREHFYQDWHDLTDEARQAKAVSLSLLTGDRALIASDTKRLYQFAGISHLLAISGSHVVFLAVILAYLTTCMSDHKPSLYHYVSRTTLRLWVMLVVAALYALFTGFDVPAVRTVYMLLVFVVVRQLALPISNLMVLAIVALVMIWLDPFVVWQAGFYLSFVAVLLLMRYDVQLSSSALSMSNKALALLKLQSWLFVAMLPISVWIFGKVSLWGLLVNLFAVGLFGMVIVPLNLLAGVAFVVMPFVADVLWGLSAGILWALHQVLVWLSGLGGDVWLYNTTGFLGVVLGVMAMLPFALPILTKRFALMPMLVCVFLLGVPKHALLIDVLTGDDNTSQVLFRQAGADPQSVNAQANWLVLSDFGSRMTPERFADVLVDNLKKHRVNHLTGVVVQTPSPMLAQVLTKVNQRIPIYHYWQAGKSTDDLVSLPCVAGRTWQGSGLSVTAITGWAQIADGDVWGCALVFDSEYVPAVHNAIGGVDKKFVANTQTNQSHRVMVGAIHHQKTWEMYELMCRVPINTDVWLTHTKSPLHAPVLTQFAPKIVLFTDKDSGQSRQKAEQIVAGLSF